MPFHLIDLPLPTSHHSLARTLRLQLRASWDIPELVLCSAPALPTWSRFYEHDIQTRNRTPRSGTCGVVPPACMPFRRSATAPPRTYLPRWLAPKSSARFARRAAAYPPRVSLGSLEFHFSACFQSSSPTISESQPSRMS